VLIVRESIEKLSKPNWQYCLVARNGDLLVSNKAENIFWQPFTQIQLNTIKQDLDIFTYPEMWWIDSVEDLRVCRQKFSCFVRKYKNQPFASRFIAEYNKLIRKKIDYYLRSDNKIESTKQQYQSYIRIFSSIYNYFHHKYTKHWHSPESESLYFFSNSQKVKISGHFSKANPLKPAQIEIVVAFFDNNIWPKFRNVNKLSDDKQMLRQIRNLFDILNIRVEDIN